jgi:hypothetical protein
MNHTQLKEPRLSFRILWARTMNEWLVSPAPFVATCDEFLGSPEKDYLGQETFVRTDGFALPEIEPEDFERVFQWFQS